MNFDQQLKLVREQKRKQYADTTGKEINDELIEHKKITIMSNLHQKYQHIFNPKIKAAIVIQSFVRKYYFRPDCINEEEIVLTPALYRFRINITSHHLNSYSEENLAEKSLPMNRLIYQMSRPSENKIIFFRYCFDVRKLHQQHQIIELYGEYYFLQPEDHNKIKIIWDKVNGVSSGSITYLNSFEYYKSLSIDMKKELNSELDNKLNKSDAMEKVKKILDNDKTIIKKHCTANKMDSDNIIFDPEYLDKLNREYIND